MAMLDYLHLELRVIYAPYYCFPGAAYQQRRFCQ